ncbi:MAG: hypothetical protein JWR62_2923 [Modestobacter sp.]|nr:hypothetical protein [Modestobacter sp.]HEV7870121.1 hypothetical protein [Modestobacter sp.]
MAHLGEALAGADAGLVAYALLRTGACTLLVLAGVAGLVLA